MYEKRSSASYTAGSARECPGGAGEVPGRCLGGAREVLFGRPAAGGARIKKKWRFRAKLSDFFGQNGPITTSFLTILTTSDFSAQARWFLMVF